MSQPSSRRLPRPVPDRQHQLRQRQDGAVRFRRCERFDGGPVDPHRAVFIDHVEVGRSGRRLVDSYRLEGFWLILGERGCSQGRDQQERETAMHPNHAVIARSEATKQSSPFRVRGSGLLRFARNDGSTGSVHVFLFASMDASCFARSRTIFLSRPVSILKKTCINFKPSRIAAVLGGPGRDARSVMTFGGSPFPLFFMFCSGRKAAPRFHN
jgi:hypothetical protein